MAREKEPYGVRQTSLRIMRNMVFNGECENDVRRDKMLDTLRTQFPKNAEEYFKTLWATFKRESRESGLAVSVYSVQDLKNGKKVEPYLKEEWCFFPADNSAWTPDRAREVYIEKMNVQIEKVKQL